MKGVLRRAVGSPQHFDIQSGSHLPLSLSVPVTNATNSPSEDPFHVDEQIPSRDATPAFKAFSVCMFT